MDRNEIQNVYPLSPMQEGMLFYSLLQEDPGMYCLQLSLTIEGDLNLDAVQRSFDALLQKHDILRTIFVHEKLQKPRQIVLKERTAKVVFENLLDLSPEQRKERWEAYEREDRSKGFDLAKDVLFRVAVFRTGERNWRMLFTHHHIILDGWCFQIVMRDFFDIYATLLGGGALSGEASPPYSSYIQWLDKQDRKEAVQYWRKRLEGYEQPSAVPALRAGKGGTYEKADYVQPLGEELQHSLTRLARTCQATLNSVMQAAWAIVLHRYNQADDVVFGAVVSGRPPEIEGIERMVGLFINTVPVRVRLRKEETFSALVQKVQRDMAEAEKYMYVSLADVQEQSPLKHRLLDHIVAYQNYPAQAADPEEEAALLKFTITGMHSHEQTNYDFNLTIAPDEGLFMINYNAARYEPEEIQAIAGHYMAVLRQAAAGPALPIEAMELADGEERRLLLELAVLAGHGRPAAHTLDIYFERQAAARPEHAALIEGGTSMTYGELNSRANRLARRLRLKGVRPNAVVGMMTGRSAEMIVGILAVLKAGGAYLPIDPAYPGERIAYMLADSGAALLLADRTSANSRVLAEFAGEVIQIEEETALESDDSNLDRLASPTDPAYIIYTSGSTGQPKGILTAHRNIERVVIDPGYINITPDDRILQLSNYAFDGSIFDIFGALLNGASLVLVPKEFMLDMGQLSAYISGQKITMFFTTTALFNTLVEVNAPALRGLRHVLFGGEQVTMSYVEKAFQVMGPGKIIHVYGPTESTVFATFYAVDRLASDSRMLPIGRPLRNTGALVLNEYGRLQPIGIPGELCITGEGLAAGYVNRPELSADRFVPCPYLDGERMYKTGDLVRLLPDGNLEYMGRIDHQVKIRGFRIEPDEIAHKLLLHKSVKEALVLPYQDEAGHSSLCAYLVPDGEWSRADIRAHLSRALPDYMIPSCFVEMERFPLTPNGKIDRRLLPEPDAVMRTVAEYEAPLTEAEQKLAGLWQQVLGVERVGRHDHFFELGGHSLKATMLIARTAKLFETPLPLQEVFARPVLRDMAALLERTPRQRYETIRPAEPRELYPASLAQKRIYVASQLDGADLSYNMPLLLRAPYPLDRQRVERSLEALAARHESLRTCVARDGEELFLKVLPRVTVPLACEAVAEEEVREIAAGWIRPFDVREAPLLRAGLIDTGNGDSILFLDMHHIISDGVSLDILLREFAQLYADPHAPLDPLPVQHKDFAVWQREQMNTEPMRKLGRYWLETFAGDIPVLQLPADFPRPSVQQFVGDTVEYELSKEMTEQLKRQAAENGTTLFLMLLAMYNLLLHKYTGQEDLVVSTPVTDRPFAELEGVVGMFVNTVPLRSFPQPDKTFGSFLEEVQRTVIQAYENQAYPAEQLFERLNLRRDVSRTPLFETIFTLQNVIESAEASGMPGWTPVEMDHHAIQFDLAVEAIEYDGTLVLRFEYSTSLFARETIERMAVHFEQLVRTALERPQARIADIEIVTDAEKAQLLGSFAGAEARPLRYRTLVEQFEAQAEKTPDERAAVFRDEAMTYRELNRRANRLAHGLRAKGVGPDDRVGLMTAPSFGTLVGIVGILKAGGAYVPIDPDYPAERIGGMLEDSGARLLVTQRGLQEGAARFPGEVLLLEDMEAADAVAARASGKESGADEAVRGTCGDGGGSLSELGNPEPVNGPDDMAYVIYTSGSTGTPKGVMIEHRSVLHLADWFGRLYGLGPGQNVLHMTSSSFDVSVEETLVSLLHGATVVIAEKPHILVREQFIPFLNKHQIDLAQFVPATLQELLADQPEQAPSLRAVLCGGERLDPVIAEKVLAQGYRLYNHYGPTEATVDATRYECVLGGKALLGRPVEGTEVLVLDSHGKLAPIGVPGELCIAGTGLARGYLNRAELNAEKFVPHPYKPGERMYRSGDEVRWLLDGNLEYLGRLDQQVKVRGYRIEPGEVSHRLLQHPAVREALVTAEREEGGHACLCAYLVTERECTVSELRAHLANSMPEYMIPSYFVKVEQFPLLPSGKINVKALPAPDLTEAGAEYAAPRNFIEETLAAIWQEVLGAERVGIYDHFFELGGHSLKVRLLTARIEKKLQVDIPLKEVFARPVLEQLAAYVEEAQRQERLKITPAGPREHYPASSAQQRMYAVSHLREARLSYNMPMAFRLEERLELSTAERAMQLLADRHESLRTSFHMNGEELVQRIAPHVRIPVHYWECGDESEADQLLSNWIRPFDLRQAPLFRAGLIRMRNGGDLLLLDMHHMISDGISIDILLEEFALICANRQEQLLPLAVQYKDFAVWQRERSNPEQMAEHERFWLDSFAGDIPVLQLPADRPRPPLQQFEGEVITAELPAGLTASIKRFSASCGATVFMTLLAAYNVLLSKYSGQEDIVIGTPVSGRPQAELDQVVGMFVDMLPIRSRPQADLTFRSFVEEVKEGVLLALEHQEYPVHEWFDKLAVQRDASRNPLFDTVFSFAAEGKASSFAGTPAVLEWKVSKFDLTLEAVEEEDEIHLHFEYSTSLFDRETIERMALRFIQLVSAMVEFPGRKLDAEMMDEAERAELDSFNQTRTEYPAGRTIQELFEEQAVRAPEQKAAVCGDLFLTYRELNGKANRLARVLRSKGVAPDQPVGLKAGHSLEMLIGILGIMKAGGAYVPIDPGYPAERIRHMLNDSGARILLAESGEGGEGACETIGLKPFLQHEGESSNPEAASGPEHLAYIVYTSGSTGVPKGVMIEQRSLVNLVYWHNRTFAITSKDRSAKFAGVGFDASVWEVFPYLIAGSTIHLIEDRIRKNIYLLSEYLETHRISVCFLPTALCEQFIRLENRSLRLLLTGGEKMHTAPEHTAYTLVNNYGPTENTVVTTSIEIRDKSQRIPIGRPIDNCQVYIMDRHMRPQPIGIPGEIWIAGAGLARGYRNLPELTAERFVAHPFAPGAKIYRSGDIGRWLPDGTLEFLGRQDNQVKVRGHRIEPGEITRQLMRMPAIREATVVAREDGQRQTYLCAYFSASQPMDIPKLRSALADVLPEYCIPAFLVQVKELPVTANGKIDHQALPEPYEFLSGSAPFAAPQNAVERELRDIWSAVLDIPSDSISVSDSFFELGGNSINILKLLSMSVSKQWNVSIQDYFELKTIENIARKIMEPARTISIDSPEVRIDLKQMARKRRPLPLTAGSRVLLTGATGFLGIHLLDDMLEQTESVICCLVRGSDQAAAEARLLEAVGYYHPDKFSRYVAALGERILVINGDITRERMGLTPSQYAKLEHGIDQIVHAAAMTKHFGDYREFEQFNIGGTETVLRLAAAGKRLHYISTMSVSGNVAQGEGEVLFREADYFVGQEFTNNVYVKSKFLAEGLVLDAIREERVDASVYRVGMITGRQADGLVQSNLADNAFTNTLETIFRLGAVSEDIHKEQSDFSPVDMCSAAIMALMQSSSEQPGIPVYHIYNPHKITISQFFRLAGIEIEVMVNERYEEWIASVSDDRERFEDLTGFMYYNVDLREEYQALVRTDSAYTQACLEESGFTWPPPAEAYVRKLIEQMKNKGYFMPRQKEGAVF
ncbi:non-ribosomal peptide synthetase [Paenibacillus thiaminolyticus]|uniref:Amino acid adenylation domain-containing protein n=1 Tax=Paenibacillus thiaminolyticus TaxID=49283 RepID=A0A3A3GBW2_PANTH|nr:non-ribosomal peptide synthetase [Paenibacillus thiaminolyticus]RJG17684.1 amino acid adenylation domain-containing protein [Paenibacillus thiaminolyticus]